LIWRSLFENSSTILLVVGALGLGFMAYVGLIWLFKTPELTMIFKALIKKIKRKPLDGQG